MIKSIFKSTNQNLACPAIHRIAPLIVKQLDKAASVVTMATVHLFVECLNILDLLVSLVNQQSSKFFSLTCSFVNSYLLTEHEMLEMVILILINCLKEDLDDVDAAKELLQDNALQRLLKIAPTAPGVFKVSFSSSFLIF